MTTSRRRLLAVAAFAVAAVVAAGDASSQFNQGQAASGTLQGFTPSRDKPVTVRAATLEVREKDKIATFTGDVHVVQGDMNLRCKVLVIYYEGETGKSESGKSEASRSDASPEQGSGGQHQIKRMLAKGSVVVMQKDQIATGDTGDFDMRANKGTLTGNVVLTQGQSVIRGGQRLNVDLTTGVYEVKAAPGRPLEMSFDPKAANSDAKQGQAPQPLQSPQQRPGRKN